MQIGQIYPEVEYPVARGTPMISPLVKYDHQQNWSVPQFSASRKDSIERKVRIDVSQEQHQYLFGHTIDGTYKHPVCNLPALPTIRFNRKFQFQTVAHWLDRRTFIWSGRQWLCSHPKRI